MVFKELVIFIACLYFELAVAAFEELEHRPKCRSHTIVCPCTDQHGLNVTVKTCSVDHSLTGKKSVCNREAILKRCRKAYLSSVRHRRNAVSENLNCLNGTIIPSESSSALKGPPNVKINGYSKNRLSGEDVTFKCSVFSNLSATVSWLFDGKALVPVKNRHSYLECKTVLHITKVLSKDVGNYTCVVQNQAGQAMASSYLYVNSRDNGPYIEYMKLEGDSGNTAYTGTTVNLTCRVQDKDVQNLFKKDGVVIYEGDAKHYEYFHMPDVENNVKIVNLEIKNITMEDAGNYTCIAVLNGPAKFATFHLKVVNLTEICSPGYYCPLGSVQPIKCPWGTYQPKVGQSSALACKRCPDFDKLNKSEPLIYSSAANITDCPMADQPTEFVEEDVQPPTPNRITPVEIIGIVAGTLGTGIVLVMFYCIAKKNRWLSRYSSTRTTYQSDLESLPCEPVFTNGECQRQSLCENMQNAAECVQIVKKAPEIDYEPKHDVFICYSYKDVDWVKELFAELEKRGFACCIDFKDFVPGAPIVENISQAICYSRKTIAVLTPDFVQSDWCSHELQKALTRIRFHQVVPVVYKSCEIPQILQDRTYLDWENCHVKPYFWDHLEKALKQPNDGVA